ncbi:PepSY domain-containing protein [Rhizobium sp. FY34]|uniref:PepSY domain-containing protein n=1 Tax=Rhizobium sp. FY34 TaxID=2562309 RepID=UPI0010BFCBC2|nr:PepSY domain-containing protein [Rhizobium sp. FY34]
MKTLLTALAASLTLAGAASAKDKCNVPVADWQPRALLRIKLEGEGWRIRSIRPEDGCYEANAVNDKGQTLDAFFDPKNFRPVEVTIEP